MKQTVLTIIAEIDPLKRPKLEEMLKQIRSDLANSYIPFPSISLLHFASFFIADNKVSPALLIFENNFDGAVSPYLSQLVTVAGEGLHQLYQCCTGYQDSYSPEKLGQFLKTNIVKPNAYHIGNVGRQAVVIKANQQLRERLQGYLDQFIIANKLNVPNALQLRQKMQAFVKADLDEDLYKQLPAHQTFLEKYLPVFRKYLVLVVAIAAVVGAVISAIRALASGLFPYALIPIVILLIILIVLRYKEERDVITATSPTVSDIEVLIKTENMFSQNHLANITDIKPGLFRLVLLKVVLWGANLLARTSTKGKLSGIPSIHFAHWSIINHNTQLLFLSNYDGSWSSYLDDFIDKAATGLTGIWCNTKNFPYTKFLVLDGARDEIHFKEYARTHQVPSLVWYSAYRDLTVQNIDKDSNIREKLFSTLSETETKEWLKLF